MNNRRLEYSTKLSRSDIRRLEMRKKRRIKRRRRRRIISSTLFFLFCCLVFIAVLKFPYSSKKSAKVENKNPSLTADGQLTTEAKLADMDYLFNIIYKDYPYLKINEKYTKKNFLAQREKYVNSIKQTKNDIEYYMKLTEVLRDLNYHGSSLISRENYDYYLNELKSLPDSPWYVAMTAKKTVDRYQTLSPGNQTNNSNNEISMDTPVPGNIAYIKIPDFSANSIEKDKQKISQFINGIKNYKNLIIDIRDNKGFSVKYFMDNLVKPLSTKTFVSNSVILEKSTDFKDYLEYIASKGSINLDKEYFSTSKYQGSPDIPKDVLDGFSAFRKYSMRVTLNPNVQFKGQIYILQNENVKNAADAFSQFANKTRFAKTVGTFTGGGGINLAPVFITLPESGFLVSLPIGMGINEDGTANAEFGTYPEIKMDGNKDALTSLIEYIH